MGLGLIATAIAGVKMTTFNSFGTGDPLRDSVTGSLYAELELWLGIIAACLPTLKAPVERLLRKHGLVSGPSMEMNASKLSFVNVNGVIAAPAAAASGPNADPERGLSGATLEMLSESPERKGSK